MILGPVILILIPIPQGLIPIPGFSKIHDSDSNSNFSSKWFRFWFQFQCCPKSLISILIIALCNSYSNSNPNVWVKILISNVCFNQIFVSLLPPIAAANPLYFTQWWHIGYACLQQTNPHRWKLNFKVFVLSKLLRYSLIVL